MKIIWNQWIGTMAYDIFMVRLIDIAEIRAEGQRSDENARR